MMMVMIIIIIVVAIFLFIVFSFQYHSIHQEEYTNINNNNYYYSLLCENATFITSKLPRSSVPLWFFAVVVVNRQNYIKM